MTQTYRIIIEPDKRGFHGYVPALPGCHTWGKTIMNTKKHIQEAIELYLESLFDKGELAPQEQGYESFVSVDVRGLKRSEKVHA